MWAIFSPEDFPKRQDDGTWADYKTMFGVTTVLKAHEWVELEEEGYDKKSWTDWMHAKEEDNPRIVHHSSRALAERLCAQPPFGFADVGLVCANLERIKPEEKKALEERAEAQNLKYRQAVVNNFEVQFRLKSQGGAGRLVPTLYEQDCYKLLGIEVPQIVNRPVPAQIINQQAPATFTPEMQKMMEDIVAAQVAAKMAELTAPAAAKSR
jgi:hypothetical protein